MVDFVLKMDRHCCCFQLANFVVTLCVTKLHLRQQVQENQETA